MERIKISDLLINDEVEGFYAVRTVTIREYTRGKYVSLELGDNSGRIGAVIWEADQFALTELTNGMVVKVRGTVGEYRNKLQLTIGKIRLATEDEFSLEDVLPHSEQSNEERRKRLFDLRDKIQNEKIRELTDSFFDDQAFLDSFLKAAAGKLWHHATIGGLTEHSANVAELALRVSQGYDFLDKDLLIFGGIFHDVGKIDTYEVGNTIDFTDQGRLIGHICLADHWITERINTIDQFPDKLAMKLRHMILAHQGELAFATPVIPKIPEAFVLYYCDEIDSKMGAIERIRNRHNGKGWSDWINLIGRHLYFGEPEEKGN